MGRATACTASIIDPTPNRISSIGLLNTVPVVISLQPGTVSQLAAQSPVPRYSITRQPCIRFKLLSGRRPARWSKGVCREAVWIFQTEFDRGYTPSSVIFVIRIKCPSSQSFPSKKLSLPSSSLSFFLFLSPYSFEAIGRGDGHRETSRKKVGKGRFAKIWKERLFVLFFNSSLRKREFVKKWKLPDRKFWIFKNFEARNPIKFPRRLLVAQTTRVMVVLFLTEIRTLAAFLKGRCFEESGQRNRWSLYSKEQNIKGSTMVARFHPCLRFL